MCFGPEDNIGFSFSDVIHSRRGFGSPSGVELKERYIFSHLGHLGFLSLERVLEQLRLCAATQVQISEKFEGFARRLTQLKLRSALLLGFTVS